MLSVQYAKDQALQAWEWHENRFRSIKQQDTFKTYRLLAFVFVFFPTEVYDKSLWSISKKETNRGT